MNLVMTKTRGCYFPRRRRRDNKTRKRSCWVFIMVPVLPQYFSGIFHNSVSSSIFLVVTIVIFFNVASSKNPFETTWGHLHFFLALVTQHIASKALRKSYCVKRFQIRNLFWSKFSRIRTEHGDLRSKSPYSVRQRENMDQKKLRIWTLFAQCPELKY